MYDCFYYMAFKISALVITISANKGCLSEDINTNASNNYE